MKEANKKKDEIMRFVDRWKGRGYEKGESQMFWLELLHDVLGVERPTETISFENQVKLSHTSFIDAYIETTKVLIEQKSVDKDLRKPIPQSDGTMLTPFQQAKRYSSELPLSRHPRWVVVCNFRSLLIYDMEQPQGEPFEVLLENLVRDAHLLGFMVTTENDQLRHEMEVSIEAGALVGKLYDAMLQQYGGEADEKDLHALNVLCVRLVFCLYAEDAGIFAKCQFANYLLGFAPEQIRVALRELFHVLDTPEEKRGRFLEPKLKAFPYVNGSLFREQDGEEIPPFTRETADLLIQEASLGFDWSQISPTIFGAVFESTLNPETRRSGGMHYTSIENIHKVIDPLFYDELCGEIGQISLLAEGKTKRERLEKFQEKLASLTFLDPACGSGNFLTETYVSLRRLENRVISLLSQGQMLLGLAEINPIKVSIHQFYGIEINDFAVTVAKTAMWIAEAQMMAETERIIRFDDDYLPLKSYENIVEGNALRIDWNEVCDAKNLDFIVGNPPFVGQALRTKEQSQDMIDVFGKGSPETKLDYVLCWYKKATQLMAENQSIIASFVSTNSICQGESVPSFWKGMSENGVEIQFAHTSFPWISESTKMASVFCVIIGFSINHRNTAKYLYSTDGKQSCSHINGYLLPAKDIWIASRTKNKDIPKIEKGSEPTDGGNLFLSKEEAEDLLSRHPELERCIRKFIGGNEITNNKAGVYNRYCLWLHETSPSLFANIQEIKTRLRKIQEIRLNSTADRIKDKADYPYLFCQIRQPKCDYIIIPRHSTSARKYIPITYMDKDVICGDSAYLIGEASLFLFGLLMSNVHNAWTKVLCGRLGMAIRYTPAVYNNFPWPTATEEERAKIEKTAQGILDARAVYPDSSLADLYDELTMPAELRKAHQANDRAVMEAYGFANTMTESDIVARLLEMYEKLSKN